MFTGIVRATGVLAHSEELRGDRRMVVKSAGLPWGNYSTGDSVAVNGVCLTAVELLADGFVADVSAETLRVTTLGALAAGARVNLEPALAAGEPLGGHLVSGHVDCQGSVCSRQEDARSVRLEVSIPDEFLRYVACKGSICIDGVSLTVNTVSPEGFGVNIIPHTARETTIGDHVAGTRVNIEVDQVARYVERLLGTHSSGERDGDINIEYLRQHGYA